MISLPILYLGYLVIIFSIIGFGYLSSKLLSIRLSIGELGLSGILFMTILSYITNLFVSHNFIHNSIFLIIGLTTFFLLILKKKLFRKKIKLILLVSSVLFIGILMYKTHDDFFYYHFPYTISLIEFKKIFGVGNLEHGLSRS